MSLKAVVDSIEGMPEDIVAHYKEVKDKEGKVKFHLDVTSVDGLALEDVTALKTTLTTLRKSEKTLRKEVEAGENTLRKYEAKFEGIDPKSAKEALDKIDDIKNWDGETKVAEAVKVATEKATVDAQARIDKLVADHNEKVTGLDTKLKSSREQLNTALVTTRIVEAISKADGNVDLLMPHVERQMKMVEDDNGKFEPQVVDAKGERRYKDIATGSYMDQDDLLVEMKDSATYAACFKGTGSSGAGKRGSDNSGDNKPSKKDKDVKHVKSTDQKAMNENIKGIASGKVVVDFETK